MHNRSLNSFGCRAHKQINVTTNLFNTRQTQESRFSFKQVAIKEVSITLLRSSESQSKV